jgi:uncharacterized coiled-coil protein SlyX
VSKIKQSRPPETLPPFSSSSLQSKDTTADEGDTAVVFSSQKSQFADYTAWKGIGTKTGIEVTISKYEEAIAEQSQRIIESDKNLKPFLEKIEDLNNQLPQLQDIRADHTLKPQGKDWEV